MKRRPCNRIMSKTWSLNLRRRALHGGCVERSGRSGVHNRSNHFASPSHMRVSVPHIPQASLLAKPTGANYTRIEAIEKLCKFILGRRTTVLTGAGVSVDSGIRAYRGPDGRYMNPNYKSVSPMSNVFRELTCCPVQAHLLPRVNGPDGEGTSL